MGALTDFLVLLGRHWVLAAVACVELAAAVLLLGAFARQKAWQKRRAAAPVGFAENEQFLLHELERQPDEVCLLVRRSDRMPLCAVGALEGLLGCTLARVQEDWNRLLENAARPEEAARLWKAYQAWQGDKPLTAALEMQSGEWLQASFHRSQDDTADILIFRRITEEHRREAEYQRQLRQAEDASRFKTSFLFRMSHEIRTPMNGITGMLRLIEGKLTPEHPAMQYVARADELSDHLLSLINDILDMSRIEAGKVELELAPFSLRAFGGKLYDMFSKQLEAKGIRYTVNYDGVTVDWVVGDELRIGQVVINFLSNAVKFTSQGEVAVTLRQMMLRGQTVDLTIRVHDTGIGMEPEFIDRIFRPFEQEDASTTRRFGGTGLGMAISDQLVRLMGGQIVVESVKDKGSDFSVILSLPVATPQQIAAADVKEPAAAAAAAPPSQAAAQTLPCRVLLAEDNEVNAMITVEILGQKGVQVDVAENGQLAVERFADAPADTYTLILMDVQMPVMDGRAAARAIRALRQPNAVSIPIYALSADAFVEDVRLSRESGMNGHLTKPIDYDRLFEIIQTAAREKEAGL